MASTIQQQICLAAKKANMYSILADETKDSSKDEQLAIVRIKFGLFSCFLNYIVT